MTSLAHDDADTLERRLDGALVCRDVHDVTHDVRSFVLEPRGPVHFEAGQYLTVTVAIDGRRHSRCYSISSPPTRPDLITLTVKRVPDGPVSGWLHDHLGVGDLLDIEGPYGSFTPPLRGRTALLFLSAGSGITPLMSAARAMVDHRTAADLVFVHHARTPDDICFRDELERMGSSAGTAIRTEVVCESDSAVEQWTGPRGRISADQLRTLVPDVADREVYVCGPAPYRSSVRQLLAATGVADDRIHEESYSLDGEDRRRLRRGDTAPSAVAATYTVELRRTGASVPCDEHTPILDAIEDAGLSLPSSCHEGVCGTCKVTMLAGAVDMVHGGGIRPREISQGGILPCCSTPTCDVVLDA